MARPKQDGLLYFPFDTDFFYADKSMKRVKARLGNNGLLFYIYLLTEIYRNGYYVRWDEESIDDAMSDLGLTEGFVEQAMRCLTARGLITKIEIVDTQQTKTAGIATQKEDDNMPGCTADIPGQFMTAVITSPGIQKRYQEAKKNCKRRIEVDPRIWLLKEEETLACIKVTNNNDIPEKNESKSGKNNNKSEKNEINKIKEKEINNICAAEPHEQTLDKETQLRHDFEIIYGIYPKKKGKTVAFAEYKKWVSRDGKDVSGKRYHLTNKQIYLAVKKYVRQQEDAGQDDLQYWKNFDTLMGRQLLDYVDFREVDK